MRQHYRFIGTILLSGLLVLLGGLLRPMPRFAAEGVPRDRFWAGKMLFPAGAYDIVLAGDSRIYRNLSPAAMQTVLHGQRIVNYAFSGCGLGTTGYLESAVRLLDPRSNDRAIVLGIHGAGLTAGSAAENGFLNLRARNHFELHAVYHLALLAGFLRPYDPEDVAAAILDRDNREGVVEVFHSDGWAASWRVSARPEATAQATRATLERFERGFIQGDQVSEAVVAQVIGAVRRWTASGIRVYGFVPPVPEEMSRLETKLGQFDERAFKGKFERAGGIWLSFPEHYASYDGSHLRMDGALRLSTDLAKALLAAEDVSSRGGVRIKP